VNALLEKQWFARVECSCGTAKFSRRCEVPAENQQQARERIESAVRSVWTGWAVRFITQPQEEK